MRLAAPCALSGETSVLVCPCPSPARLRWAARGGRRGGSGEVARVGSVAEALSCAISLKMIAFRSQGVELRDLTLCV